MLYLNVSLVDQVFGGTSSFLLAAELLLNLVRFHKYDQTQWQLLALIKLHWVYVAALR